MGPSGKLKGALLGGWAKPAACGCGGLASGGEGDLAPPPTLTTLPCPPIPFNTRGWHFSGQGCCGSLAARGCPCNHLVSCRGVPVGGPGEQPEVPGWEGELEGGVVKAGWRAHHRDPTDQGSQWPYLPPRFPLPSHLYIEEVDIRRWARDTERKSWDHLRQSGHQVLKMPPLQLLPMPWRLLAMEEGRFWWGQDVAMEADLELGHLPPRVQLEEAEWQIPWVPAEELAKEGSPLSALGPGPLEVDGAEQVPEDGATAGEATDEETNSSLAHASPS